jgi:RNA polymerase sigma factor (sigma-70 family)
VPDPWYVPRCPDTGLAPDLMSPWLSDVLLRSQSDERLITLARDGHDRAFTTLIERYRPELLAFARRLNSDGRAEDILQQALLGAFAAVRSGTEVNHVRGWLYQIVRNAATKARSSRDLPLDDAVVVAEPLEDVVQRRATALSALTELGRLPERQRDALVAVALNGRAGADVAVTMGLSEGALRQLVHRARATLRGALTAVTPWPLARWLAAMGGAPAPDIVAGAGFASAGGITAKVGALLATGLLASTVTVLPSGNHAPRAASRSRPSRAGHTAAIHTHPAPAAGGGPTAIRSLTPPGTQTRFGRSPVNSSRKPAHHDRGDRGRSDSRGSDGSDRRDGNSGENRSGSGAGLLQSASTSGRSGGDGDRTVRRESRAVLASVRSDSRSGGGHGGADGGGSGGSGSGGGGHADSGSGSTSSDTHRTADN